MRKIKFRGKSKETGEWVHGYLIVATGCVNNGRAYICPEVTSVYFNLEDFDIGGFIEVDPDTVGQYTGLKDKNGKEIYEDDICVYTNRKNPDLNRTGIIKFVYGYFGLTFDDGRVGVLANILDEELEIVGNIYENSELIV